MSDEVSSWELEAALAVLRQAQRELVSLDDATGGCLDPQTCAAAEQRCRSARRIVERIRSTLEHTS